MKKGDKVSFFSHILAESTLERSLNNGSDSHALECPKLKFFVCDEAFLTLNKIGQSYETLTCAMLSYFSMLTPNFRIC